MDESPGCCIGINRLKGMFVQNVNGGNKATGPALVREREKSLESQTGKVYKSQMAGASGEGNRETGWEQMTRSFQSYEPRFPSFTRERSETTTEGDSILLLWILCVWTLPACSSWFLSPTPHTRGTGAWAFLRGLVA